MIRVTTYTSHPGSQVEQGAEITGILVQIMDDDEIVLAESSIGFEEERAPLVAATAARASFRLLKDKVIQAEKELKAMGLLS